MAGDVDAADVRRIVTEGLSPYVGATMASASVSGHLERLGVTTGTIAEAQVDALLERLAPGLSVFIGPGRSEAVVDNIRRAIDHARRTA